MIIGVVKRMTQTCSKLSSSPLLQVPLGTVLRLRGRRPRVATVRRPLIRVSEERQRRRRRLEGRTTGIQGIDKKFYWNFGTRCYYCR